MVSAEQHVLGREVEVHPPARLAPVASGAANPPDRGAVLSPLRRSVEEPTRACGMPGPRRRRPRLDAAARDPAPPPAARPASPDQLAAAIGASRTGVLQQLRALEAAELVTRQTVRHGVGRPRHLYDVTPTPGALPLELRRPRRRDCSRRSAIGGEALLDELFAAAGARSATDPAADGGAPPDASLVDRVRELAVIQDEQGYLASRTSAPAA